MPLLSVFGCPVFGLLCRHGITANVLQLPEGGDFEALHCPSTPRSSSVAKL